MSRGSRWGQIEFRSLVLTMKAKGHTKAYGGVEVKRQKNKNLKVES